MHRLLFGLGGIRFVGERVARVLSRHFREIDVLAVASVEEIASVDEVGPKIAASVAAFFLPRKRPEIFWPS